MTTLQQQRPTVITPSSRRTALIVGVAVIGLVIGLLGGWLLFGADDVISVHNTEMTDRQNEMIALVEADFAAWQARDVDTVLSYYTDDAVFVALDEEYLVADGGLARFVTTFLGAPSMDDIGPDVVVDENTLITFHTFDEETRVNIIDFTSSGELLIVRHEVTN